MLEMAGGDELRSIPVHLDCMFVATVNVGAEYTGTMTAVYGSINMSLQTKFY